MGVFVPTWPSYEQDVPASSPERDAAIHTLTQRLGLFDAWTEDWAVEAADADRLQEFCRLYTQSPSVLSLPEKCALMELIIASLDNYLAHTPFSLYDPEVCGTIERLLEHDYSLHACTIQQWCRSEEDSESDDGPLSSFAPQEMRRSSVTSIDPTGDPDPTQWPFCVAPILRRIRLRCEP